MSSVIKVRFYTMFQCVPGDISNLAVVAVCHVHLADTNQRLETLEHALCVVVEELMLQLVQHHLPNVPVSN